MSLQWNAVLTTGSSVRINRSLRTGEQGFTLIQVMVAVALFLVIASIATMAYQGLIDDARAAACENNLKVLNTAVELYADEYGVIPAVLGELKLEHFEKAYARVMEKNGWHTKLSLALLRLSQSDEACAEFLTYENLAKFGAAKDSFSCPGDKNGGTSYGINANLAGTLWAKVATDVVVVGDCDSPTFTSAAQLKKRHGSGKVAIAMTKGGAVVKMGEGSDAEIPDGVDPSFVVDEDAVADSDANDDPSEVRSRIDVIYNADPGSALGIKMHDVLVKIADADLKRAASQNDGAVSELEAAVGVLQSAIGDGLLDPGEGQELVDDLNAEIEGINAIP